MDNIEYIVYTNETVGSLTVKDVCRYMAERNFKNIEIVDVNRIEHLNEEVINNNNFYNINVEVGIEVITNLKGISLIALGVDKNNYENIENYIDEKEKEKADIYKKILKCLKEKFSIELDEREVLLYTHKNFLNLIDIAKLLYKKGFVPTTRQAITHYINECDLLYENNKNDIEELIEKLKYVSNKIYYYNYDKKDKSYDIEQKYGIKELDIRTFENHQEEEIY